MVEQHRIENTELLRKRQAQYEEKVNLDFFFFFSK